MKVGILAAGDGARLLQGGIQVPKPLVPIAGLPLIGHLLHALQHLDLEEIVCILNTRGTAVVDYVQERYPALPLTFVQRDTASSYESFTVLCAQLSGSPFLVTTIDTLFDPAWLPQFVNAARQQVGADMVLSLTRFIDDEKPLYVQLDAQQRIVQLGLAAQGSSTVTSGLYYCAPTIPTACAALPLGSVGALRQFLAWLLDRGYGLHGCLGPTMIDVDRPQDIAVAERFVQTWQGH